MSQRTPISLPLPSLLLILAALLLTEARAQGDLAGYSPTTDVTAQAAIDVDVQEMIALVSSSSSSSDNGWQACLAFYNQSPLVNLSRTEDGVAMRDATHVNSDFFPFFAPYYEYFGSTEYAHDFFTNGLSGSVTTSGYTGNFDFSQLTLGGGTNDDDDDETIAARTALVETVPVVLTLLIYVIRNLELAVTECQACASSSFEESSTATFGETIFNATQPHCGSARLDEAVAYYVGSLHGGTAAPHGVLGYALADKLCGAFATCVTSAVSTDSETDATGVTGMSQVNALVMSELQAMQQNIQGNVCSEALFNKDAIRAQLLVPIVQGLLHALRMIEMQDRTSRNRWATEATVMAAALLPLVHACSGTDAAIVYEATKPGGTLDGDIVQYTLQQQYVCLGLTCEDVGGVWNATRGRYADGWEPCNTAPTVSPAPSGTVATNSPAWTKPFPTVTTPPAVPSPSLVDVVPSGTTTEAASSSSNRYGLLSCWMTSLLIALPVLRLISLL